MISDHARERAQAYGIPNHLLSLSDNYPADTGVILRQTRDYIEVAIRRLSARGCGAITTTVVKRPATRELSPRHFNVDTLAWLRQAKEKL